MYAFEANQASQENYEGSEMAELTVTQMWYEYSIPNDSVNMLYILRDAKGNELKREVRPRKVYAWQVK